MSHRQYILFLGCFIQTVRYLHPFWSSEFQLYSLAPSSLFYQRLYAILFDILCGSPKGKFK